MVYDNHKLFLTYCFPDILWYCSVNDMADDYLERWSESSAPSPFPFPSQKEPAPFPYKEELAESTAGDAVAGTADLHRR